MDCLSYLSTYKVKDLTGQSLESAVQQDGVDLWVAQKSGDRGLQGSRMFMCDQTAVSALSACRSCYQLAYSQAQDILDGGAAAAGEEIPAAQRSDLRSRLQVLERVSAMRRSARLEVAPCAMFYRTSAHCLLLSIFRQVMHAGQMR